MALSAAPPRKNLLRRVSPLALLALLALPVTKTCDDTREQIGHAVSPVDFISKARQPASPDSPVFLPRDDATVPTTPTPTLTSVQKGVRTVLSRRTPDEQEPIDLQSSVDMLKVSMPEEVRLKWDVLQKNCDAFFEMATIDDTTPYSLQPLEYIGLVYQSFMADLVNNGVSGSLLNASLEDACGSLDDINNHTVHLATKMMGDTNVNEYEKNVIIDDLKKVLKNLGLDTSPLDELTDNIFFDEKQYADYAENLVTEITKLTCVRGPDYVSALYKLSMALEAMSPEDLGIDQAEYNALSEIVNPNLADLVQDLYSKFSSTYMDYILESQDGLNDHVNHVLGIKLAAFNALNDLINVMLMYGFSSDEIDPALDWPKLLVLREELQVSAAEEECYYSNHLGLDQFFGMVF